MKSNNSELIEYLEGKFTSVDERFGQVTEGFQYVVKHFGSYGRGGFDSLLGINAAARNAASGSLLAGASTFPVPFAVMFASVWLVDPL